MNGIALLKCICDETRFEILTVLQGGESSVGGLVSKTGKDQPLVSHHLKTLRKCGIVKSRDEGKRVTVWNIKSAVVCPDCRHYRCKQKDSGNCVTGSVASLQKADRTCR